MGKKDKSAAGGGRGGAQAGLVDIDPADVYFTHARIRPFFSCGRRVHETLESLTKGEIAIADLPPISLIGSMTPCGIGPPYFSLNNRRLFVFKELRKLGLVTTVAARIKPPVDSKRERERYTVEKMSLTARLMVGVNPAKKDGDDDDADADAGSSAESENDEVQAAPTPAPSSSKPGKAGRGQKRGKAVAGGPAQGGDSDGGEPSRGGGGGGGKRKKGARSLADDADLLGGGDVDADAFDDAPAKRGGGGRKKDKGRGKRGSKDPTDATATTRSGGRNTNDADDSDAGDAADDVPKMIKGDWKKSVGDVTLYSFDMNSLNPKKWIRDSVISAWFEILAADFESAVDGRGVRLVDPSVAFLLMHGDEGTVRAVFDSIAGGAAQVLLAVNNSKTCDAAVSGSHWSLLSYTAATNAWAALDSAGGMNVDIARSLAARLAPFLPDGNATPSADIMFSQADTPQQANDSDCGVHVMINVAAALDINNFPADATAFRMALKQALWVREE